MDRSSSYLYVALGCSITEGRGKSIRYPDLIKNHLEKKMPGKEVRMIVQAYPGAVAGGKQDACEKLGFPKVNTYERLYPELIEIDPDLVTVMLGQPDSLQSFIPIEDFEYYFDLIIKALLKDTRAQVIVGGRVYNKIHSYSKHRPPWNNGSVEKARSYNEKMKEIAGKNKIPFFDFYEAMDSKDDLFLFDGVHPNRVGHEFIANKLIEMLETYGLTRPQSN